MNTKKGLSIMAVLISLGLILALNRLREKSSMPRMRVLYDMR